MGQELRVGQEEVWDRTGREVGQDVEYDRKNEWNKKRSGTGR